MLNQLLIEQLVYINMYEVYTRKFVLIKTSYGVYKDK